jgi:nitrogen fixation NifU-like protein
MGRVKGSYTWPGKLIRAVKSFSRGAEKMAQEFDDSFRELEQSVMEDMKKVYSEKMIDHFLNPRNLGEIPAPNGFARVTGPCGDTMEIYVKVSDGRIVNASFWTDGCGTTIASGSMVTELAKGKSITETLKITQNDVLDALGGFPEESLHCALLAANTLKEAIKDYLAFKKEPWKRVYRSG